MSILKNRHIVVAVLVAPVLALVAWFGADYLIGERPQAAVVGQSYPLAEMPGCRYAGGACALKNEDFELQIAFRPAAPARVILQVDSAFPLDGIVVALVSSNDAEDEPRTLRRAEPGGQSWTIELPRPRPDRDRLRIAVSAAGVQYFGEVATLFAQPEDAAD
jgi:hypothetical protein